MPARPHDASGSSFSTCTVSASASSQRLQQAGAVAALPVIVPRLLLVVVLHEHRVGHPDRVVKPLPAVARAGDHVPDDASRGPPVLAPVPAVAGGRRPAQVGARMPRQQRLHPVRDRRQCLHVRGDTVARCRSRSRCAPSASPVHEFASRISSSSTAEFRRERGDPQRQARPHAGVVAQHVAQQLAGAIDHGRLVVELGRAAHVAHEPHHARPVQAPQQARSPRPAR